MKNLRGITLVEMLISITIFSLVIVGSSIFFARMWRLNQYTINMGIASLTASRNIKEMAGYIRKARESETGAFAIEYADEEEIFFYMDYDEDGTTERMHYFLQDSTLHMGVCEPQFAGASVLYNDADEVVVSTIPHVINQLRGDTLFAYYGSDKEIYAYDTANDNALPTPVVTSDITMIKMMLTVNPDAAREKEDTHIQSFAVVRNLANFDQTVSP